MSEPRVLIVSNRLPISVKVTQGQVDVSQSSGGLASGMSDYQTRAGGVWIGWPGETAHLTPAQRKELEGVLVDRGIAPVYLTAQEVRQYYENFSNGVLWPLFHYLLDRVPTGDRDWETYEAVNRKFADRIAAHYRPGDLVWVHDYQLTLVPGMLRERVPDARIGFFLHIPFPSSEIFRVLPWRQQVLEGMLGADLIGFHTYAYLRHFATSVLHLLGVEPDINQLRFRERQIRLGVYPMGVDARRFEALARTPEVATEAATIRESAGGRQILLGVDRLDYTKGIPRRLLAFERLIEQKPDLRDRIQLIQVAVPSRTTLESYRGFRQRVEETVGRINGAQGTLRSTPVHYLYRHLTDQELVALYLAADVLLVTPLRDGMNLVAKEFVASRVDEDGVLVLSEFAGAAAELGEAVLINPYDMQQLAESIETALTMEVSERRTRMRTLRGRVRRFDVHQWAARFTNDLGHTDATVSGHAQVALDAAGIAEIAERLRNSDRLVLILDYDGTLVPLASAPDLARPDPRLYDLLRGLARRPRTTLFLVSGRSRDTLERWFADVPITLVAEHGFWTRAAPGSAWDATDTPPTEPLAKVRPILEQFTQATPGSLIEDKTASVAWHYRMVAPGFGERQAHELRMVLGDALSNQPLEVMEGKKVVEVRLRGVNKSTVAKRVLSDEQPATIVAMGDDRTDEDLFAALPADAISVHVGDGDTQAAFRVRDWRAARRMLAAVAEVPA